VVQAAVHSLGEKVIQAIPLHRGQQASLNDTAVLKKLTIRVPAVHLPPIPNNLNVGIVAENAAQKLVGQESTAPYDDAFQASPFHMNRAAKFTMKAAAGQ
jgi:hypothetical protein